MAGKRKIGATIALDGEQEFKRAVTGVNKEITTMKSSMSLLKEQTSGQANSLETLRKRCSTSSQTTERTPGYTVAINSASGNLYRSALTSLALPPQIYNNYTVDIIHAEVNCAHNNYPAWGMVASYYATGINFYAMSGGSRGSSPNYTLDAYVFGTIS